MIRIDYRLDRITDRGKRCVRSLCSVGLMAVAMLPAGCTTDADSRENSQPAPQMLEFTVTSRSGQTAGDTAAGSDKELQIKSLYIYAYDDVHRYPDRFVQTDIPDNGGELTVQMPVNGTGQKRFYLIANPPLSVAEQLDANLEEGSVQTLGLYLTRPLLSIDELPDYEDGTGQSQTGFPMGNSLVAYVERIQGEALKLGLYARKETGGGEDAFGYSGRITRLPLVRSLGKVEVNACLKNFKEGETAQVAGLYIYNYTLDGLFLPVWQKAEEEAWPDYWTVDEPTATATWNPRLQMNLHEQARYETRVNNDAFPLLNARVEVTAVYDQKSPGQVSPVSSFYLLQNSYGKKEEDALQEGLEDQTGTRTSFLIVSLDDGRTSEVELPYLRRNDRLKVRLIINPNTIEFEFLKWNTSEVTPDWDDGVIRPDTDVMD